MAEGLSKDFRSRRGRSIKALDGVSFNAPSGGITCVVGPTGSGKSTILRIMSGLELPDSGRVQVGGRNPAEEQAELGYLTQRHTLFPWLRVKDNIALPLEIRGMGAEERREKVRAVCEAFGLTMAVDLYPYELSGGMQQRTALARLLVMDVRFWLLDEPFSALDDRTRHQLQKLLIDTVRRKDVSVLFVTHSIDEAVYLSDRIVVLSAGPGRVLDVIDPDMPHPRNRISANYGKLIEHIRRKIEYVLELNDQSDPDGKETDGACF